MNKKINLNILFFSIIILIFNIIVFIDTCKFYKKEVIYNYKNYKIIDYKFNNSEYNGKLRLYKNNKKIYTLFYTDKNKYECFEQEWKWIYYDIEKIEGRIISLYDSELLIKEYEKCFNKF